MPFLEQPSLQRSYGPTVLSRHAVVRLRAGPLTTGKRSLVLRQWADAQAALVDALQAAGVETTLLKAAIERPAAPEACHLTVSVLLARTAASLMVTASSPWRDFGAVDSGSAEVLAYWNDWMDAVGVTAGRQTIRLIELAFTAREALGEACLDALKAVYAARVDSFYYPMVRTAEARGIPWRAVRPGSKIISYGQGARQQWFHGTMSNAQSRVCVHLAMRKHLSMGLLRAAGLPVPEHVVARNRAEATAAAARLGFPVVVKPDAGSRSQNVFLNLTNEAAVEEAFDSCHDLGMRTLVEKHYPGLPYRITVCGGKAFSTLRHAVPYVVGDGETTLRGLIEQLNESRHRAVEDDYRLPGALDIAGIAEELDERLGEQDITLEDIPVAGREIFLKFLPTLSGGGAHVDVSDKVHPSTLELAEEAARVLHAKHLGFDLITADIARPHEEVPLVFNEVNAAPGIRSHSVVVGPSRNLQDTILSPLFPPGDSGRIPIAAAIGAGVEDFLPLAEDLLTAKGETVGYADSKAARVKGCLLRPVEGAAAHPGLALLRDKRPSVAVMSCRDEDLISRGLPSDRLDVVLIPGVPSENGGDEVSMAAIVAMVTLPGDALVLPFGAEAAWVKQAAPHRRVILVSDQAAAGDMPLPDAILVTVEGAGKARRLAVYQGPRKDPLGRLPVRGSDDQAAAWAAALLLGFGINALEATRLISARCADAMAPASLAAN